MNVPRTILFSAVLCPLAAFPALAQTSTHARSTSAAHHTATGEGGCVKVFETSPKLPALPAGSSCPKALYTIVVPPTPRLEDVSPMEGAGLPDALGLETARFTLSYVDTRVGTGELAPPKEFYTVEYTGYFPSGEKFDSSYDHTPKEPFTFPYGAHNVILGWDTGLNGMRVGGKRRLYVPYQLAYGAQGKPGPGGQGGIPPRANLVFDIELVSVSREAPKAKTPAAPPTVSSPSKLGTPPAAPATSAPAKPATPPKP